MDRGPDEGRPSRRMLLRVAALVPIGVVPATVLATAGSSWRYEPVTAKALEFSRPWWEFGEGDWARELDVVCPGLYDHYRIGPGGTGPELLGIASNRSIPFWHRSAYARSQDPPIPNPPGASERSALSDDAAEHAKATNQAEDAIRALRNLQAMHGKRIEVFYTGRTES